MLFKDLSISRKLVEDLDFHGIVSLTKVQEEAIPLIMKGKDVLVQSETGSGKTIAFAIPTIESCKKEGKIQVIVLAPTRELAKQISEEYVKFSKGKELSTAIVYGGVSIDDQARKVKNADILVGTPGRILDLLRRRELNLTYVKCFILDEADRMLDMGFIEDIDSIIKSLPSARQNLMFSATINGKVLKLMTSYLRNPDKVLLENVIKPGVLEEFYFDLQENQKLSYLTHLLKKEKNLVLVFCKTKPRTEFVANVLKDNGIKAEAINGDMSQHAREKVMGDFAEKKINVLVATDVAARGIHVEDISHVINYDVPDGFETYTHRIGRTARNGKHGVAITLLSDRDYDSMRKIQKSHDNIKRKDAERFEPIRIKRPFPGREDNSRRINKTRYKHDGSNKFIHRRV